jgi:hypothetical protein
MNNNTEYLYAFANATITLRVIKFLREQNQDWLEKITVINLINGWLVKIKLVDTVQSHFAKNIQAFLNEMGIVYTASMPVDLALKQLEQGTNPVEVMRRYKVVVVAHGESEQEEIELFRQQFVERLGYCPPNMA